MSLKIDLTGDDDVDTTKSDRHEVQNVPANVPEGAAGFSIKQNRRRSDGVVPGAVEVDRSEGRPSGWQPPPALVSTIQDNAAFQKPRVIRPNNGKARELRDSEVNAPQGGEVRRKGRGLRTPRMGCPRTRGLHQSTRPAFHKVDAGVRDARERSSTGGDVGVGSGVHPSKRRKAENSSDFYVGVRACYDALEAVAEQIDATFRQLEAIDALVSLKVLALGRVCAHSNTAPAGGREPAAGAAGGPEDEAGLADSDATTVDYRTPGSGEDDTLECHDEILESVYSPQGGGILRPMGEQPLRRCNI